MTKDFIEDDDGEDDSFVERADEDSYVGNTAVDNEKDERRLFSRLRNRRFLEWLKRNGHDRNAATPQMVDEFDQLQHEESCKRRRAMSPPSPPVDIINPAKTDAIEWDAGVDEWTREGGQPETVPLERPSWEALLRRRAARLNEEAKQAEIKLRRQRQINSLKPPKLSEVALNSRSICEAESAYQEGREKLSDAWDSRYRELPPNVAAAWRVYHDPEGDPEIYLRPRVPTPDDFPADVTKIEDGLNAPEYQKFQRYSAAILQQLEQLKTNFEHTLNPPAGSRPPLKGWSLDQIDENDGSVWPVPTVIPHGLTFVYGLPKGGKSLWMQKLSACIAGDVPFDGIEDLEHGRVLYITRDIGASRQEVKKRLMKILPRIGLPVDALDGKLILTDDPFYLNDPASVDNLLAHNPGRFVLVVFDSLFRCVSGSLSQDVVASAAVDAIERISRATGAAIVAIHHEPRSSEHLFGSVMLDAAYDAKIHVKRGKERNSVIVEVQELKNAPVPSKPFTYKIEEEYLAAEASAVPAAAPRLASSRHQEMLALMPTGWFTRKEGRKLVEPLLTGTEDARRKQWQRAVAAMKASGEIELSVKGMRKT